MASLFFLIIHPIVYPIYCGGKGKAMKLIGKGNRPFCYHLPVAGIQLFRLEKRAFLSSNIAYCCRLRNRKQRTDNPPANKQPATSNQNPLVLRMELSQDTKNILGLQLPTDPRWVDLAERSLEEILTDHAYCEQKAATSCISIIQRYSDKEKIVDELSPIVTEEWGHFRLVLAELQKRNLKLGRQRKDEYVNELLKFEMRGGGEEDRMLDKLLLCALIEARSCERFKRLSEGLNDEYLSNFYRRFMESEAGHYTLFIELAETYIDKDKVRNRWKEWLRYEAGIMRQLTPRGDRIH
jgi:tRNA-(ms[2]io[6]A)-hydroxylase